MTTGNTNRMAAAAAGLLGMSLLAGCASESPKVDYYTLSANEVPALRGSEAAGCSKIPITIGPITWPRYLDQPRIATRSGSNRLNFDEFNRWAGSLRDDFGRALRKNLSGLLQSEYLAIYGSGARFRTRYRVELDVEQFDGEMGGDVILDVNWAVFVQESGKLLGRPQTTTIRKTATGPAYAALVQASSQAVAELAREIAVELAEVCVSAHE